MQKTKQVAEWQRIGNGLMTIRMCSHAREVDVRYNDCKGLRFQTCRDCWNHKEYHEISEDSVQVIRPNQLDAEYVKCLKCGSGMDSCGCGIA